MPGVRIYLLLGGEVNSKTWGKKGKQTNIPWPNGLIIRSKPMRSYPMNPSKAPRVSLSPVAWKDSSQHDPKRDQNDRAAE